MRHQARIAAPWLVLLSLLSFSSPSSRASCAGAKQFGQVSPENGYNYVLFPSDAEVANGSILGRFWTPGARAGANEGTCVASDWLVPCDPAVYPCGGGAAGYAFYINGSLNGGTCASAGCVTGEMITLIETTSAGQDTAYFAVGRVDETPVLSLAFDDSRIGRDWTLREIPRPVVTGVHLVPPNIVLDFSIEDPGSGFFGLAGVPASGTLTAFRLFEYRRPLGGAPPGRQTGSWALVDRFPYSGGTTTGSHMTTCENSPYYAVAIEFGGGEFVTDYVGREVWINCGGSSPPGPGAVPETGTPLLVDKASKGDIALTWGALSCEYFPIDYEVYEGTVGDFASHGYRTCSTGGAATYTFTPAEGDRYFLVVPRNDGVEGSYGQGSGGAERPQGSPACFERYLQGCYIGPV